MSLQNWQIANLQKKLKASALQHRARGMDMMQEKRSIESAVEYGRGEGILEAMREIAKAGKREQKYVEAPSEEL